MPWLFLLLALAAFAVAFTTSSMPLTVVCLLAALGLLVAWVMGLLAQRVGSQTRDDSLMLDPQELRRLREQAEARRAAAASAHRDDRSETAASTAAASASLGGDSAGSGS